MTKCTAGDEGSATVVGVSVILGVVALVAIIGGQISEVVHQHRADAAADLVALSAAMVHYSYGVARACDRAVDIAVQNGAVLEECHEIVGGGTEAPAGTPSKVGMSVTVAVDGQRRSADAGP